MFFKNREIRVRIANTKNEENGSAEMEERFAIDPEQIYEIGQKLIKQGVIAITAVVLIVKAADTLSQIAVKKSTHKDEE